MSFSVSPLWVKQVQVNEDSTHWRPIMLLWDKWEQPNIPAASSGQSTSCGPSSIPSEDSHLPEQSTTNQIAATPPSGTPSECPPDLPNEPLEGLRAGHKVRLTILVYVLKIEQTGVHVWLYASIVS